jgi:hypothetical protein
MPRGPKGERPADVIGNAVHVMQQIIRDAEELGEPGDNRHHAALSALIANIFDDRFVKAV